MDKSHKGTIQGERIDISRKITKGFPANLGFIIGGYFVDHPEFKRMRGHTSLIVKKGRWKTDDCENCECEVETLNSRYTWRKPGVQIKA